MCRFTIQSQYFFLDLRNWGRNKTSSGTKWFSYDAWNRRVNIWPVSVWLLPFKKISE